MHSELYIDEKEMFGTVLPSTRTKRPFEYADIELIQLLFDEQAIDNHVHECFKMVFQVIQRLLGLAS